VVKKEWGTKRECAECGARFYDLNRDPITCPKCDTVFVTETSKPRAKPKAKPEPAPTPAAPAAAPANDDKAEGEVDEEVALLSEAGIEAEETEDDAEEGSDGLIAGEFDGDDGEDVSDVLDAPIESGGTSEGT